MSFLRRYSQQQGANHPSLDNLRRAQPSVNGGGNHSSYPQLPNGGSMNGHGGIGPDDLRDREQDDSPLDTIISIIFGFAALVCMFGVTTTLSILYVTVRPFSTSAYRRLAAQLGEGAFLDAVALLLPNKCLYLTGDSDVPSPVGTSLMVCNHLVDGDWWDVLMLGRCVGLRGSIKVFLRKELLQINGNRPEMANGRSVSDAVASASKPQQKISTTTSPTNTNKRVTFGRTNISCPNGYSPGVSPQMSIVGKLLHFLLEFPVLSAENNKDYVSDREGLFSLLRSFAQNNGNDAPIHLLLYPEGWSVHDKSLKDRKAVLAKSNEFAKREGRPQLKHLLLPRSTGFNASLESLRESSPIVYDVTVAYRGYDGSLQPSQDLNLLTLWNTLRRKTPNEIHLRIKRYSMEEVLQDSKWLDKQWAEKDRLLSHFSRHQCFPTDNRGFAKHRVFDTRHHSIEGSVLALARLLIVPFTIPFLLLVFLPVFWAILWIWLAHQSYKLLFPDPQASGSGNDDAAGANASQTPGSAGVDSATGTPFFPATPFASPSISNWRDMINNRDTHP